VTATTANSDIFSNAYPEHQTEVRQRLDEIWAACAARDFDLLESFHGYGPKFTSFKDGALRAGADANAADERRFFSILEENRVDMADLAINVFADVAVVTFNGRYSGVLGGNPISADQQTTMVLVNDDGAWKIVHEHMSPIGSPPER
jgi:ketosteroid isomerase-like protein